MRLQTDQEFKQRKIYDLNKKIQCNYVYNELKG